MEVASIYSWPVSASVARKNSPLLPKNVRGLIIGKSNCGKTTVLMNLLLQPDWLDYNHLYVFGLSLHQMEYKVLQKGFKIGLTKAQLTNLFANQNVLKEKKITPLEILSEYNGIRNGKIKADFFGDCSLIPDPADIDKNEKNLLILDDCILGKQRMAEAYYTRRRHNNCDTFYISQNYFLLPRQTIRENANFIILFPQDMKNLSHIHADHCATDMTLDEFKKFCISIWNSPGYNSVVIDLTSNKMNGKYRKNLDTFYFPDCIN